MKGPAVRRLAGGKRLHLQHGPIDLIVGAEGEREVAFRAAAARFSGILEELVVELPQLRMPVSDVSRVRGAVARAMEAAARPHVPVFVTPMAAVAGAVADAVLQAMVAEAEPQRAYVNNGGDIALWLTPGAQVSLAMKDHLNWDLGRIEIRHGDGVGGIATSGRHGRSLSLGIADSVTVLARSAAEADVAATLIANAVDLPGHPGIERAPARDLDPESDLGERPVVTECGGLSHADQIRALDRGVQTAGSMQARGLVASAALFLERRARILGDEFFMGPSVHEKELEAEA